jgi:hypothetical protein
MSAPLPQAKRPFDDSYLWRYSNEHLCYEVDHFFWLVPLFKGPSLVIASSPSLTVTGTRDDVGRLRNGLIESTVVHLRNIIAFLFVELTPNNSTDVLAADYCVSADIWKDLRDLSATAWKKPEPAPTRKLRISRRTDNSDTRRRRIGISKNSQRSSSRYFFYCLKMRYLIG